MSIHAVILLLAIPAFVNIIWLLASKPGDKQRGVGIVYAIWIISLIIIALYWASIH